MPDKKVPEANSMPRRRPNPVTGCTSTAALAQARREDYDCASPLDESISHPGGRHTMAHLGRFTVEMIRPPGAG
ncbi:MAG TPA: hypothetical protein VIQ60_13760 [Gemmatimonadaceae bacterium]